MRKSRIKPILIAFTAVFLFQHSIVAQSYDIPSSVVGNGGESVTSANYDLTGTVGQAVTGTGLSSSSYQHGAGFWPAVSPPLFVDISAGLLGVFDGSVAWGDFDNDGDLDILLTGDSDLSAVTSNAAIYTNGSFTQSLTAVLTGTYNGDAAWGDYDNDGDLDVVITGYTGTERIAKVYRNNGDATLTDVGASITGVNLSSVAWGDYDNDGDLDLAITGFNGSTRVSQIYENTDGSFSDISAGLPGVTGGSVAWGDYDEDGDLDLLMTGDNTGTSPYIASIYKNTDGTFTDISASFTGVFNGTAQWGDYDNDGDLDVLVTGDDGTSGITKLYRNDVSTGGSFTEMATAGFTGVSYSSAAWGDYDNDGDLDVALAGGLNIGRHTAVYRNNGNDTFSDIGANLTTVFHSSVAWGDYDNDGDLDLLVSGQTDTDALTKVYRNDAQTANTAPSVPSSPTLINVISENSADLSWAKFTDTETAQNALTYNVRVGTSPGGVETVSPMAFTSGVNEGRRKVPAMGNAGQRTSWTVKNLPDGTYYWSLQAIDNGFTGSSFAPEVTFAIDIAPGAPAGLTASAGDGEIVLTWNKNSEGDVAKYRVYGDIASSPTTQVDSTTNAGDTTTTLTGLTNGQTYYYRVTAVDTGGNESGYSNEIAATPGDETAPSAPTGVVAEAGDTEITLTWNQNPETDVGKYRIYGDTSPAPVTKVDSTTTIGDTTRTITGLINYTTYYYRITAVDNAGNESGYSAEVSIAPRDLTPPAAPTGLVAEAGDRQVTLTWNRNDEDDADKYRIYGGTTPAPTTPVDSTLSPGDTTKTITGLANGTTYYYHITAVDTANNESNFSNEVNVTPGDNTPPAAPSGLIAQAGDGQVKLTWAENTEGDVVKYRIYGDTSPGPVDQVDSTTSVNDTTRTLTGLINDITYYYRLTAVDTAENESDFSSEASATPGAGNVAPAVTLLSPNGGQLWSEDHFHLIRWQATDDDSVTRISLLYSPDGGINYTSIRDSLVNDGRFRWRIPRGPVTTAMVKVIAYDAEGVSAEDESDGVFTIEDVSTHVLATGAISHTIRNDGWTGALGGSVGTTTTTSILGLSGSSSHEGTVSKKSTRAEVSSPGRNLRTESRNISSTAGSTEPSLEFPPGSGNHHLFIGQFLFAFVNDVLDTFAVRLYGDDFLPLYPIEVYPETDYVETWTGYGDRLDLDIDVEEATFSATDEPFIIQEYTLYNWSGETYSNLYLASFADFDISDYTVNLSGYEAPDRLAFMYNDLGDWGYAGIRMLDQDPTVFRRWGGGVFTPVTEGQIFRALSSPGIDNTSGDSPDDYRIVEALGPFTLPSDDSLRVAFALVAGADLTALRQASRRAQAFWDEINEVTRTISGNVTYPGFEQNYPNGELFVDVWEDPSEWPFPPEGPVTTVFIGPPVDFMNPVPYVIDDPILQPGHDYYVGAVFDEDNTFQPPTPEAEAWYGTDLASGKINLDAGSVTGIDLPLVPIAGAVGLWIGDVGTDFIDLNWDRWPDVDSDFNRYEIHRNNSGNVTLADPTVLNEPNVNVTSWRDVDVVEGQDYYYKLWMFDQAGIRYETMEVWATPGVMGHVDGTITSTETGSGELVVGLFEPGNESPWSPDFERSFPGTSFPGDYFYVFDEPGIYDAFGWEVRAFLDENQNFFPDQGEMKGKSGEFEISGGAAFDIDFAVGYPPVGTGSISGDLIASKAADGQLYLALWFPASDPDMDPPDIVQPEVYVDFQSPGATWFYEFTDLPDGNGYTVAAFLDQAGSAGVGPDTCDPGEDLAGMRRGISISGGVQVTNQDVNLEDCSQFEPEIPIPDAVDNVSLDWYTGGDQPWFGQGTVTHDGIDAAQSGAIGDDGDSWLDADIEINGAGTVSFWWKVSSEDGGDFLRLYEEGNEVDAISGEVDWQQGSLNVCDYTYVSWSYEKNSSGSAGDDAGWLDEVTFTPGLFGTGQVSAFLDDIFLVGEVGEADTFNLGFENSGDGPVVITNITSSEPDLFTPDPDWIDLPEYVCPGDPFTVRMLLSPSSEGTYTGSVTFELANATASTYTIPFTIEVFGQGSVSINTGTVFFTSDNDTSLAPQGTGVNIDLTGLQNIWDVDDPYLQVNLVDGSVPPGNPAGDMGMAVASRYWEIFTNLPAGFSADICFDLSDLASGTLLDGIQDFLALKILRRPVYSDGSWVVITDVTYDEQSNTVCAMGQTEFSQWTVGGDSSGINFTPALPVITGNIQNLTAQEGQDFPVQVDIEAEAGLDVARLTYFVGAELSPRQTPFSLQSGMTYEAVIPGNDVTSKGLVGFVGARDSIGREVSSDTVGIRVQFADIPMGNVPKEQYAMISVPGDLADKNQTAVLGDELGAYDKTEWRLFRWNGTAYTEFEGNANFAPGDAFWIITREAKTLSAGSGKSVQLVPPYSLDLTQGWNQAGTPYDFDVDLERLTYPPGAIEPAFYEYDPSTNGYKTTTTMKPGRGYWVWAWENTSLRLAPPIVSLARTGEEAKPLEWGGTLKASAGRGYVQDTQNVFGVLENASQEWDPWDRHEPPVIGDYISLAFDARGWKDRGGLYSRDIRAKGAEGYEWPLVVRTDQKGYVNLDVEWTRNLPAGWEAYLVDRDIGVARDLIQQPGYVFASSGSEQPRRFVLVVGSSDFAQEKVAEYVAVPEDYHLFQNMPNPFNAVTTIRFSLPEESDVTLVVYDILGHEVARLVSGKTYRTGTHVVLWDGKDGYGAPASSGVYLYRMVARNSGTMTYQTAKKLILLK